MEPEKGSLTEFCLDWEQFNFVDRSGMENALLAFTPSVPKGQWHRFLGRSMQFAERNIPELRLPGQFMQFESVSADARNCPA
jgi:hypothetical protein